MPFGRPILGGGYASVRSQHRRSQRKVGSPERELTLGHCDQSPRPTSGVGVFFGQNASSPPHGIGASAGRAATDCRHSNSCSERKLIWVTSRGIEESGLGKQLSAARRTLGSRQIANHGTDPQPSHRPAGVLEVLINLVQHLCSRGITTRTRCGDQVITKSRFSNVGGV